ncbi:hypothetical protein N7447_004167 [Penicillium robsamsonii]|uniref:uncharacterized protein n=1 Tax=Penicillium robsamsonii TaxID=1792511 RepID=UPI002548A70B|nr:uncharacterized protein N7447_004167 [Penicillium robsamsonii]KAJ5827404.1 hypothetical protein N7447_004167 [Penicillium robsamsonii]
MKNKKLFRRRCGNGLFTFIMVHGRVGLRRTVQVNLIPMVYNCLRVSQEAWVQIPLLSYDQNSMLRVKLFLSCTGSLGRRLRLVEFTFLKKRRRITRRTKAKNRKTNALGWVSDERELERCRAVIQSIKDGLMEHSSTKMEKTAGVYHFRFDDHEEDA